MPANYEQIQSLIGATLNKDVTYQSKPLDLRNQRTYAVKVSQALGQGISRPLTSDSTQAGVNSLLDVARQTYKEANDDVVELASQLGGDLLSTEPERRRSSNIDLRDV